jgi:DNA recombination protein RmuC
MLESTGGLSLEVVVILTAVIAVIVGYLFALVVMRPKLATAQSQLETVTHELTQQTQQLSNTEQQLKITEEKQHALTVSNAELSTKNQAQVESLSEVRNKLLTLEALTTQLELQKHTAETALEASKVELSENQKAQHLLNERVAELVNTVQLQQNELKKQQAISSQLSEQKRAAEVTAEQNAKRLTEAQLRITELSEKIEQVSNRYVALQKHNQQLETSLEERDKNHQEQIKNFESQKQALAKEFENIANKIFEEKGKSFSQASQDNINLLLKPFRDQIDSFQKRVNEVHEQSIKGTTNLNSEIKKVLEIGLKMSDEASNLTTALKGDSQQRGAWGEAQLERTLEMSGLIEDAHFEKQSSFKDLDGKSKQTDYLIKLPDDKHIIIDSKVSLIAYDRAISAETPEAYTLSMQDHVKAVKKHIDDLASKDYTNLIGMRSPSFVLMFMPIEPAYIDALKTNKDLFSYGYNRGIVLVSHTTLIPILRTVANLWMLEKSNVEAREISEKAGDIFNQVCIIAERLQKLGGSLSTVSNHYNNTVKALAGQQGLYGKVERFKTISNKVSKSLVNLETNHLDFESEKLSLIAEPIVNNSSNNTSDKKEITGQETDNKKSDS